MHKARNVAITIIALALIAVAPMIVTAPGSGFQEQPPASSPVVPPMLVPEPPSPPEPSPPEPSPPDPSPPDPSPPDPSPPDPSPPEPDVARPRGIDVPVAAPRVLTSERAKIENAWQDQLDGIWVQVFAGCMPGNLSQGVVWVVEVQFDGSQKLHAYKTPAAAGCVRIVAADGTQLILSAGDGQAFVFDAATQEFQA